MPKLILKCRAILISLIHQFPDGTQTSVPNLILLKRDDLGNWLIDTRDMSDVKRMDIKRMDTGDLIEITQAWNHLCKDGDLRIFLDGKPHYFIETLPTDPTC